MTRRQHATPGHPRQDEQEAQDEQRMGELQAGGERIRNQGEAPPVRPLTTGHGQSGTGSPERSRASVRQRAWPGPALALLGLVGLAYAVFAFRLLTPAYPGGDLLYHGALALGLLRDGLPLQGAYAGLPAYYPPGFHVLLAIPMATLGLAPVDAAGLLFLVLLPLLPLGTWLLALRLTGRPWVAVLAVAITLFGGAYNLNPLRQWVNSLFMGGHAAWTAYPRDLVFAILPFAVYAFVRALEGGGGRRRVAWALVSGALLGVAALVQVQLLLPVPFAFALTGAVVVARDPERRARAVVALGACFVVALAIGAPWLLGTVEEIRRYGGVALDSSDLLEPARFAPWSYPREFGLLLPLAAVGSGALLLLLRRPDGPRPAGAPGPWRPSLAEGGVLLTAWWAIPFALGILYDPAWPLEDALRPQRLWLMASQPLAILAAAGLATLAEEALLRRGRRLVIASVVLVTLAASVPATWATAAIVSQTWTRDAYATLDRALDRVPHFDALLGRTGPPATVLAPEDWSGLAWFETGLQVVGLVPPGYAKLAFDPASATGASQAERRAAQVRAWSGDPSGLTAIADRFHATRIVVPRDGDRWALLDLAAAGLAAADPTAAPGIPVVEGNGWDALALGTGDRLLLPGGPATQLRLTAKARLVSDGGAPTGLRILALPADASGGGQLVGTVELVAGADGWLRGGAEVRADPGGRLAIEATGPILLQGVAAWVPAPPIPAGWRVAVQADEATVLERAP